MGINVELARSQANQLNQFASTLRELQRNLGEYKGSLNYVWQAEEMIYANKAIVSIMNQLTNCSNSLDTLGSDIYSTALVIRREEEIREAEERARQQMLLEQMQRAKMK